MFRYFVISLLAFVICACSTSKIIEEPPVLLPSGITTGEIEAAIRGAINSYNGSWLIEEANPGSIIAGLHVRNHYMKVEIRYSEHDISSHIINSVNLKQDKDSIHKKALYWQHRLNLSVNLELNKLSMPLETVSRMPETIDLHTSGDIPATKELKTQDQTHPEKKEETISRALGQEGPESVPQEPMETGKKDQDNKDSNRSWKTYFEIQDEKAGDLK